MLQDQYYDKIKTLYKLSKLNWFVEQHAKHNAKQNSDDLERFESLQEALQYHIAEFKKALNS